VSRVKRQTRHNTGHFGGGAKIKQEVMTVRKMKLLIHSCLKYLSEEKHFVTFSTWIYLVTVCFTVSSF